MFFGSYYPLNPTLNLTALNNKRPSTEPINTTAKKTITTSMVEFQTVSTNFATFTSMQNPYLESNNQTSNLDDKILNIIHKMSLSDVMDIIMQLLTIFWSAAAGNLQLAFSNSSQKYFFFISTLNLIFK